MESEDKDSEEDKDDDSYVKERNDAPLGASKHLQKKAKKQARKQAKVREKETPTLLYLECGMRGVGSDMH